MSSGNVYESLFKQWASVSKLVVDGKRSPEEVCRLLQMIIDEKVTAKLGADTALEAWLADWSAFYKDVFNLDLSFGGTLSVPARRLGFDRLIVVAEGMTPQRLYDKCAELFPCWKHADRNLDKIIVSDRTAKNGHYAIWVRNRQEADEENKNLSADHLKKRRTPEITLEERELYELKFFKETGKHLDEVNWTLCAGSRYSDGHVPYANCYDRFKVRRSCVSDHHGNSRSRSVVS